MQLQPSCVECGAPAAKDPRGADLYRKFCSDECMRRHNNRKYRRRLPPLASRPTKNCAYCGAEFVAKSRDRQYCYDGWCRQYAYAERKANGESRVGPRTVRCDGCLTEFETVRPEARWCSKQCANRHWGNVRARQRPNPSVADYTDLEIFQRDGWVCHLCGDLVNPKYDRTHPEGATIDHIVPVARGGLDVASNVATAHWRCNLAKGCGAVTPPT